jgi:hypothetical protein
MRPPPYAISLLQLRSVVLEKIHVLGKKRSDIAIVFTDWDPSHSGLEPGIDAMEQRYLHRLNRRRAIAYKRSNPTFRSGLRRLGDALDSIWHAFA